jgi:hypothetical protein
VDEGYKILIAAGLSFCCLGVFLFEMVKHIELAVTIDKLVALGIALVYIVAACFAGPRAMSVILTSILPALGLIWFAEEVGSMTGMSIRGGRVSKASPAFLIALFGWLFLLTPIGLAIYAGFVAAGQ